MNQFCAFCGKACVTFRGLSKHIKLKHKTRLSAEEKQKFLKAFKVVSHPDLNGMLVWY